MIYLDNASTTKPSSGVRETVFKTLDIFGNPSSMHHLGVEAEKIIKKAKENTARVIGVNPNNIYFTSGGTESNNTAILGYCRANIKKGKHIITTAVEHPSVLTPFKMLEAEGFDVTYLTVNSGGIISLEELANSVREDTIFVSIMLVNNEIGAIMPVSEVKKIIQQKNSKAVLHIDAVQGYGKVDCKPNQWGIDMLSASGHKIHAIKGCGILYVADNINIKPLLNGGGQQNNMRSGTENTVGIAAFSKASEEILNYDREKVVILRSLLKEEIIKNIDRVKVNEAEGQNQAGHILNISFSGVRSEILLHSLEMYEIYVSTGSACSTNKPMPSYVLTEMGCTPQEIDGAVRFSLCENITQEDIHYTVDALKKEVAQIRKYTRR